MSVATIPARAGWSTEVKAGQAFRITDVAGSQAADLWVYNKADMEEFLSTLHTAVMMKGIYPRPGWNFFSNHRRPILEFLEDTSTGEHDLLRPACDPYWYEHLGAEPGHGSCQENFQKQMHELGYERAWATQPVNLFTNCKVEGEEGALVLGPSSSSAGDYVTLKALIDCHVIISACPQDMLGIFDGGPTELEFRLVD